MISVEDRTGGTAEEIMARLAAGTGTPDDIRTLEQAAEVLYRHSVELLALAMLARQRLARGDGWTPEESRHGGD